jgi:hypothetical protein
MKIRKAIKTIVALGTGLTMLGATVFGAVATDLGDYPSQFIKDGVFDGLMVVGATAKTDDVLGVVDIATSLQYSARGAGDGSEEVVVEGDAYLFESKTNKLEITEYVGAIESKVDGDNLEVLKTTSVRTSRGTTDVKQKLEFSTTEGLELVFDRNNDDPKIVGDYLKVESGNTLFNYTMTFENDLKSRNTSATDSKLKDLRDKELFI